MQRKTSRFCLFFIIITGLLCWVSFKPFNVKEDPSPPRTPTEELASFVIEPGLQIMLVASEPMIQDPVVSLFDADGRLWVVEMRGFMRNIDGSGENEPIGRISILEDTDGDGQMDKSTLYLDSLVMPRALAIIKGGALVAENGALWLTKDLNNDQKADTKILIDSAYAGSPLPEHSGNGLWRALDNWYYNAKSRFRYRVENGNWLRDSTEFRGQWGICGDNEGRLIYNYNWSQLHADLVPPNYLSQNRNHKPTTGIDHGLTVDRRIYPIRSNLAVNRGYIPGTLDSMQRLIEFTAACSPYNYRETALPKQYHGNVFVCEPSGNLVKRNLIDEKGFNLSARDAHPGREFLASTDERFRPVHLSTGPDGALYVTDMYRGVVQHAAYITPYLREESVKRNLVQPVHYGRIWRIVPNNWKSSKQKKLSQASSHELVDSLSSVDGWKRDLAQRLLIELNDKKVQSNLEKVSLQGKNTFGRLHALWTLEGLHLLRPALLLTLALDGNTVISTTALRILEPFAKKNNFTRVKLEQALLHLWPEATAKQSLQLALSAYPARSKILNEVLAGIISKHGNEPLIRDAVLSSLQNRESNFLYHLWNLPKWKTHEVYKEIIVEMLATAIMHKKNAHELNLVLSMLNRTSNRQTNWRAQAVITGLLMGGNSNRNARVKLSTAPTLFTKPVISYPAKELAVLASMFEWPGHAGENVVVKKSLLNDEQQQMFAQGRQLYLTTCAGCHGTDGAGLKRFAPPLIGSEWVLGNEKQLALIVLHGMEGSVEVAGKKYDSPDILPVMPAHSTMDDGTITSILTYIRNEWGNNGGPISKRTVGVTRNTSQGRVMPWKAEELKKYILETATADSRQ